MSEKNDSHDMSFSNRLHSFLFHPVTVLVTTLLSIIGVVLSIFFYYKSEKSRELTYAINPSKAIVVKSGQSSDLSVSFHDQKIDGDITAVQIAFWNAGNEAIKEENILTPFIIQLADSVQILEASIRKVSRDLTGIQINSMDMFAGKIGLTWNILEHLDGGVIQIIYAGTPEININATTTIEEQGEIQYINLSGASKDTAEEKTKTLRKMAIVLLVFGPLMILLAIYRKIKKRGSNTFLIGGIVSGTLYGGFGIWLLFSYPTIPFGF